MRNRSRPWRFGILPPLLALLFVLVGEERFPRLHSLPVADHVPVGVSSEPRASTGTRAADAELLDLQGDLQAILRSTGNRDARWGVLAISLDRGDTLLALNPRRRMVPASNTKLLTTSAALHILGPDFTYQTFVLARGPHRGGALEGDLILFGTGDPTQSDRFYPSRDAPMDSLAAFVAAAGITEITGDLRVDGTFFRGPVLHPEWNPADFNESFAAPVTSVIFNENLLTLRVEPGLRTGVRPMVHTLPPASGVPVLNSARTRPGGTRSRIWLTRETPADPISIEGEIPLRGRDVWRRLPVSDPLTFYGGQLRRALERRGIRVHGRVRGVRNPLESSLGPSFAGEGRRSGSPRILGVLESPPLVEILRVVNKESHNLFAEAVGKTLGRVVLGDGSFRGGAEVVSRFLAQEVGISEEEIRVKDASGLSPFNGLSPGAMLQLLTFMEASPRWEEYWSTLPEAGVRRELGRMYRSPAARNLRAKTGTMRGVSALSGMVRTRTGERILFSIIANEVASEYRAKRAEDQVGIRLASLTRPLPAPEKEEGRP